MEELKLIPPQKFAIEYFSSAHTAPLERILTSDRMLNVENEPESQWQVIKDIRRTFVSEFTLQHKAIFLRCIFKIPRARNRRNWERLLTLFRPPDVVRALRSMELAEQLGVTAPRPILAATRRQFGMVTHSYMVYEKLDGHTPKSHADIQQVCELLTDLHRKGWLRRDALLRNFLIIGENRVGLIDFRLSRPRLLVKARQGLECEKLISSTPVAEQYLDSDYRQLVSFRFLSGLHRLKMFIKRVKKRRRL